MPESVFTPKITREPEPEPVVEMPEAKNDGTGALFLKVAQFAIVGMFGFLPVFFTPGLWASLGFDKALFALVLGLVALMSVSLLSLRRRRVRTVLPIPLGLFWGLVMAALVSGLLTGDVQDAVRGSGLETQTVGFLAIMGLVMSTALVLQGSKAMSMKALALFGGVSALLLSYNVVRILFGGGVLTFGSFGGVTVSPIGGFNDLAIFAGLTIILGLVTLLQLPLRAGLQYFIAALVVLSLFVLAVVNFFNIWIIIGFLGLLLFIYLVSRDTLFKLEGSAGDVAPVSRVLLGVTALVCLFSAQFIVMGEYSGNRISEWTGINYVEVRPSTEATIGIASAVYSENLLLGVGPNRFADAWRQHKDRSINETIFWDTDFVAGSGYVPTLFVNLGLLGGLFLLAFHVMLLWVGYKMLVRNTNNDSYWYYFGLVSFTGAVFLWLMTYIYVPGAAILLLAALFTGMTFAAYGANVPAAVKQVPLAVNRQRGFVLMAAIIFIISASVGVLFSVGEQYVAQARFNEARATAESVPEFEQVALTSFGLFPDDRFVSARAQIQLANLNALVSIPEPTEEDQQRFLVSAEQALVFAEQAVAEDPTNPDNYAVLAGIYSSLAMAGIDGAQQRSDEALARARELDPLNPGYRLVSAQMAARIGDVESARAEIREALNLKRNFTQALYLSAQLDIAEGNATSAIATTQAIITLEPNNPTRYFQLGVLLSATGDTERAVAAYRRAIQLDPNYANARYLLALALFAGGDTDGALAELRIVQSTNQENQQLATLISQIESGELTAPPDLGLETPVSELAPIEGTEGDVITESDVESDLLTPVNTVPSNEADQSSAPAEPDATESDAAPEADEVPVEGGE